MYLLDIGVQSVSAGLRVIRALLKMIDAENKFWGLKVMD